MTRYSFSHYAGLSQIFSYRRALRASASLICAALAPRNYLAAEHATRRRRHADIKPLQCRAYAMFILSNTAFSAGHARKMLQAFAQHAHEAAT